MSRELTGKIRLHFFGDFVHLMERMPAVPGLLSIVNHNRLCRHRYAKQFPVMIENQSLVEKELDASALVRAALVLGVQNEQTGFVVDFSFVNDVRDLSTESPDNFLAAYKCQFIQIYSRKLNGIEPCLQ